MKRENLIIELKRQTDQEWEVIVIGGGATGLGIALDSVTRGYKTLLLERSDFSQGTSSRSTKLVHGGVRYLAQGDVLLVIEALRERGRMLRNAPHITTDQEFIIPLYSLFDVFLYYFGLKFYDILSGRLSLGKSYYISKEEVAGRLPIINDAGLKGGIVYHDGQFDDSRMAVSVASEFVKRGGVALNYFPVEDLLKDADGKICGVVATDTQSEIKYELRAGLVINATGVFADEIIKLDDPQAENIIRPSQGVHIVLDRKFLQADSAIMIPKTSDGRVLFAIPWYNRVVVGTTDTPLGEISAEPSALDEEIDFILTTAGKYLSVKPLRSDILSVFAGLRPLASDPGNPESTKEISRRHKIILSYSGLLSVTGGKWTTYRVMAEETLDKAIRAGMLRKSPCITKEMIIDQIPDNLPSGHLSTYGIKAQEIVELIRNDPGLGTALCSSLPYTRAEIIWICRNEMPVNLDDMLARRTRALFLDARASMEMSGEVAEIMAGEMGKDENWQKEQVTSFLQLAGNYL